ncbi:DUF4439 domain-containing protein [Janibacter sp. G1551]|uniref:DUF4439 domain-containing protein n=1 Tax=Janibacter sp. G1551 TaxID=3420440 RepID=UPI003CFC3FE4
MSQTRERGTMLGMSTPGAHTPSRRVILGSLPLALAATFLTGCDVEFEEDAPFVPARTPIPGETNLLDLLASTAVGTRMSGVDPRVSGAVTGQVAPLSAALLAAEVPDDVIAAAEGTSVASAPSTTTATPSGEPTAATPPPDPLSQPGLDLGLAALSGADTSLVPLIGALVAQRMAGSEIAGLDLTWAAPGDDAWVDPTAAIDLVKATREAVYAFEVVTAQSSEGSAQRKRAGKTLTFLRALEAAQAGASGSATPPHDLGGELPFPVTSAGAAKRLATRTLDRLADAHAATFAASATQRGSTLAIATWLARVEVQRHGWGLALEPFPGLTASA